MIRFGKIYIISLLLCVLIVATTAYISDQIKYEDPENAGTLIGINLPSYEIYHVGTNRYILNFSSQLSAQEYDKIKNSWKEDGDSQYSAAHDGIVTYKATFDSQFNSMNIYVHHDYPGTIFAYGLILCALLFALFVLVVIGLVYLIAMLFSKKFNHPTYIKWLIFVLSLLAVSFLFNSDLYISVIKTIIDVV